MPPRFSLKLRIIVLFGGLIAVAFVLMWHFAVDAMRMEKREDLRTALRHIAQETRGYDAPSMRAFLHIRANAHLLDRVDALHVRGEYAQHPRVEDEKHIIINFPIERGYWVLSSENDRLEMKVAAYGWKLFHHGLVALIAVVILGGLGLGYFLGELTQLAQLIRQWRNEERPTWNPKSEEIAHIRDAFGVLMDRLEGYRQNEKALTKEAAHALKTPLAIMYARLDWYESTMVYPKEQCIEEMRADMERLRRALETILFLESATLHHPIRMDLGEVMRALMERLEPLARRKGVHFVVHERPCTLEVSEQLLGKVLGALMDNAIMYAASNTIVQIDILPCEVTITNTKGGDHALFSSKIGQSMLQRLQHDLGCVYRIDEDDVRYIVTLVFER